METIKLLDGIFTPNEAKEILLDLINKKINFHNLKNLSSHVHYNQPDAESENRIKQLKEARNFLLTLIQEAKDTQSDLIIQSRINIACLTKEQANELCLTEESY